LEGNEAVIVCAIDKITPKSNTSYILGNTRR
jgi:hypothetical protein